MSWTFVAISALREARKQYEVDRSRRAAALTKEADAQRLLNEDRDWRAFLEAVKAYEIGGNDPTALKVAKENGRSFPGFHEFTSHGFTLVYYCDSKTKLAQAILFYKESSFVEQAQDLWRRLKSKMV